MRQFIEQPGLEVLVVDGGVRLNALLMMPVATGGSCLGVFAGGKPLLGQMSEPQVVGRIWPAHFGGYPAGVDGVAENVGPDSSDGSGERGDEELAVGVGAR